MLCSAAAQAELFSAGEKIQDDGRAAGEGGGGRDEEVAAAAAVVAFVSVFELSLAAELVQSKD